MGNPMLGSDIEVCGDHVDFKQRVSESASSVGLNAVLELLEKDLKLSERLIEDNKAKDIDMVRTFQIKRGHTRDLISQVKALGI